MVRGLKKNDIDDICLMIFVCRTLNNNNLTSLPRDLFEPLSRLRVLRLSENKWLCDCHLAWLGRFLRRHARAGSPLAANGYLPRCHAPFGLRIKAVSELLDTEFKCTGKSVIVKKKNFFFLLLLLLCILLPISVSV